MFGEFNGFYLQLKIYTELSLTYIQYNRVIYDVLCRNVVSFLFCILALFRYSFDFDLINLTLFKNLNNDIYTHTRNTH